MTNDDSTTLNQMILGSKELKNEEDFQEWSNKVTEMVNPGGSDDYPWIATLNVTGLGGEPLEARKLMHIRSALYHLHNATEETNAEVMEELNSLEEKVMELEDKMKHQTTLGGEAE